MKSSRCCDRGDCVDGKAMSLNRCCTDTLKHYAPRQPLEGMEIACRWCTGYLRYEAITPRLLGWMPHERTKDFVDRETNPEAVAAREARYAEITRGAYDSRLKDVPATRACARCASEGWFELGTLIRIRDGQAIYECPKEHVARVNLS